MVQRCTRNLNNLEFRASRCDAATGTIREPKTPAALQRGGGQRTCYRLRRWSATPTRPRPSGLSVAGSGMHQPPNRKLPNPNSTRTGAPVSFATSTFTSKSIRRSASKTINATSITLAAPPGMPQAPSSKIAPRAFVSALGSCQRYCRCKRRARRCGRRSCRRRFDHGWMRRRAPPGRYPALDVGCQDADKFPQRIIPQDIGVSAVVDFDHGAVGGTHGNTVADCLHR